MQEPLKLPCGAILKNRMAKAAMTEGLASSAGHATPELKRLYQVWNQSGCGMLLTGNVHIDEDHLERPGNVLVDSKNNKDPKAMEALQEWTQAATQNDVHLWAQISHAGRQTRNDVNPNPKSPSDVQLKVPGGKFNKPTPMTAAEIQAVKEGFVNAAVTCQKTGFTGVQVHAAHGYLLSQFLSPRSNLRTDDYGGSLENRARLLLEIVRDIRQQVGPKFPISVKINSADFQKGGFNFSESLQVANWLQEAGIDLLEISGGNYEQASMMDIDGLLEPVEEQNVKQSTKEREAYFLDFAAAMQETVTIPLMVTGGFRSKRAIEAALASKNVDLIGLGRPLCYAPRCVQELFDGTIEDLPQKEHELVMFPWYLGFLRYFSILAAIESFGKQFWFYAQLYAIGETGETDLEKSVFSSLLLVDRREREWLVDRKKYLQG